MVKARRNVLLLVLALLLVAGLLLFRGRQPTGGLDAAAAPIPTQRPPTEAERQAALQTMAEEGSFRFRMEMSPKVTGRTATLLLENPVENSESLSVTITLDGSGETIYTGEPLPPGAQRLTDEISIDLPPGEHPATAAVSPLDTAGVPTGEPLQLALTLYVAEPEPAVPTLQQP